MAIRDTDSIPYRQTFAYKRACVIAAEQRAKMHHRRLELWPTFWPSTSAMLRRPRFV